MDVATIVRALVARIGGRAVAWSQTAVRRSAAHRLARQLAIARPDPAAALDAALAHAATDVPYWRDRLGAGDRRAAFLALPPLTKDAIRANAQALRHDALGRRRWWINHSGGSSGAPIAVVQDREVADWSMATSAWYLAHHLGVTHEVPKVVLWGSERDLFGQRASRVARVQGVLTQTVMLNSFKMDATTMRRYVATLARTRPVYVRGYAGSLFELAQFALAEGLTIPPPRFVYSTAETLTAAARAVIERGFGAPVFDFYGSREVGPIAGQGRDGLMHVFDFFNRVEVVDAHGAAVGAGGEGQVLVTSLRNRAMPLLRYDIGDTAEVAAVGPDGGVRTLRRVTGRVTDHFVAASGALIHGEYFTHLFYGDHAIREFQVVQHRVDDVEILWAPRDPGADVTIAARTDRDAKIRLVLGDGCAVRWTRVDEVPLTPQGKRLFTRSLVHRSAR